MHCGSDASSERHTKLSQHVQKFDPSSKGEPIGLPSSRQFRPTKANLSESNKTFIGLYFRPGVLGRSPWSSMRLIKDLKHDYSCQVFYRFSSFFMVSWRFVWRLARVMHWDQHDSVRFDCCEFLLSDLLLFVQRYMWIQNCEPLVEEAAFALNSTLWHQGLRTLP